MRIPAIFLSALLSISACDANPSEGTLLGDLGCPRPSDLAPALPPCPAANGLAGDPLLCVNFAPLSDQTLTSPPPQQLSGWSFGKDSMNNDCWETAGGVLQIKNFKMLTGDCGLFLPPINLNDAKYSKYQSLTLSLRHRVDVETSSQQQAGIFLDTANASRQLNTTTDRNLSQQFVLTIDKTDLPAMSSGGYRYLLRLQAPLSAGGSRQGWQISSVAVLGNP